MSFPIAFFLEGPRFSYRERRNKRMVTVHGQCPVPKGNRKIARVVPGTEKNKHPTANVTDPPRAKAAQKALTLALLEHRPEEPFPGAVRLDVTFVFVPPEGWPAYRQEAALAGYEEPTQTTFGDRDNLHKLLADSLEGAGFMANDSKITKGDVSKSYGPVRGYQVWLCDLPRRPTHAEWKLRKAKRAAGHPHVEEVS